MENICERGVDPLVPIHEKAWTWKTMWGRDLRWLTTEVKKCLGVYLYIYIYLVILCIHII